MKTFFSFPSRDGKHEISSIIWQDKTVTPIAVVQIIHGMAEFLERYEEIATYLAKQGFIVVGDDHLGHGKTAETTNELGYFCKRHAHIVLVRDEHRLKKIIQQKFPRLPYFILGHSMGSLILRNYLMHYGQGIQGAIICGTGYYNKLAVLAGKFLISTLKLSQREYKKSALMDQILFGNFNAKTDKDTSFDWLCNDKNVVEQYMNHPKCGFLFTINGYETLLNLCFHITNKNALQKMPKELPLFIISGKQDPVGKYGKGIDLLYDSYKKIGMQNVKMKLYDDCRHELLNEEKKNEIYSDIKNWVVSIINN